MTMHGQNHIKFTGNCSVLLLTFFYLPVLGHCFTQLHSRTHATLGRTPLDEESARRRDLYLTRQNIRKGQTSMPASGLESRIPADPRLWAFDQLITLLLH